MPLQEDNQQRGGVMKRSTYHFKAIVTHILEYSYHILYNRSVLFLLYHSTLPTIS